MTHYKATDKNMVCQNHKFELGKEYKTKGRIELCENGFHSCENPLDILNFYDLCESRFFKVTPAGKILNDDVKSCSAKITLDVELSLSEYIENAVKYIIDLCKIKKIEDDYSTQAAAGYSSKQAAAGNSSTQAAAGYYSTQAAAGNFSTQAAAGNYSTQITKGKNSISVAIGKNSKIKAVKGTWITLAEYDSEGIVSFVKTARIGYTKQEGKVLKENVFYTLENKKFKEIS